jgi:hypothetical protein
MTKKTQETTRFTNDWTREVDTLRDTIKEALSCGSEQEMRDILSKVIK